MKRDVGVLLVHGIGQQPEGDTLLAFGEPLVRWTDRWLHRTTTDGATGVFEVITSRLTPSKTGDAFPPHATARLLVTENGQERDSTWLMAESWWGGDVQAPPFGRFAGWMLTIGAWTVVAHMTKWARRYENKAARLVVEILTTGVGLVLAILLQIAVLVLSILALLPIPALRRGLSSALLALTGVVGDCYVLVESDLQRAAIVTRTRAALEWLARNCEKVVVIAHSQGAAVAHYALRSATPANVELLVTLGSGLGKLGELEHSSKTEGRVRSMARMAPLVVLLLALLAYITLFERRDDLSEMALFFVAFLAFISVVRVFFMAREHWEHVDERARELSLAGVRPKLRWVDIYASSDPVPNGAMLPRGARIEGVESYPVVNLRSFLRDHTTYWQNRCEFVPRVLREVNDALELGLFTVEEGKALDAVERRHQRNVLWLSISKWAAMLSVVLLFWLYGDVFLARGRELAPRLSGAGTPFDSLLTRVAGAGMFVLRLLFRGNATNVGLQLVGGAIPLVLIGGWQYAYRFLWRWWDGVALEDVFKPGSIGRADHVALAITVIVLGLAPLAVVVAWPLLVGILIGHLIAGTWIGLYALLSFIATVRVAIKGVGLSVASRRGDRAARAELKKELTALAGILLLLAFLLWVALPRFEPTRDTGFGVIAFGLNGWLFWKVQTWFVKRLRGMNYRPAVTWAALVAPAVLAISVTAILAATFGAQRGESSLPWYVGLLITLAMLYVIAILLASGLVMLVRRLRPPTAEASGESA